MKLRTLLKPLSFIPALLLMYLIFRFSAQEAELSTDVSYKVSYTIVNGANYLFDTGLDDYQLSDYAWRINGVTRKLAHMTEYFLLAVAMSFPLYVYGLRGILLVIVAGGICVGYACADEYHQSFVAGRAASMRDIGIDSLGVLIGIILVRIIGWTGRHTLFAPAPDENYERMSRKERKRYQKKQAMMEEEIRQLRRENQAMYEEVHGRTANAAPDLSGAPSPYYGHGQGEYARPHRDDYARAHYYGADYGQPYPEGEPYPGNERSSDELSDDMPLSRLLKPR